MRRPVTVIHEPPHRGSAEGLHYTVDIFRRPDRLRRQARGDEARVTERLARHGQGLPVAC